MSEYYQTIVLGAGMGGLAAAALRAKQGQSTLLLEAHKTPGGCAGYFARESGFFDVGATTISGLLPNRPTSRLFRQLGIELPIIRQDIPLTIHLRSGKTFSFYRDHQHFIQEFKRCFQIDISTFLKKCLSIEGQLWSLLGKVQQFPPRNPIQLIGSEILLFLKYPKLIGNFKSFLPREIRDNEEVLQFFDQLLMISTQQSSHRVPAFMGLLGFLYPFDCYAIEGGMKSLNQKLVKSIRDSGGKLGFDHRVLNIERNGDRFTITTAKKTFECDNLISNLPPGVHRNFSYQGEWYQAKENSQGELWGALTGYISFRTTAELKSLYKQVHLSKDHSIFFSFSEKSPTRDFHRLTVSTHVEISRYKDYQKKIKIEEQFKRDVEHSLYSLFSNQIDFKWEGLGNPRVFERYTSRPDGIVGGLRHQGLFDLFRLLPTKKNDIIHVGDFTFPGQGIVATFQSALNSSSQ